VIEGPGGDVIQIASLERHARKIRLRILAFRNVFALTRRLSLTTV